MIHPFGARLSLPCALLLLLVTSRSATPANPQDLSGDAMERRTGRFEAEYPPPAEQDSSKLVEIACRRNNNSKLPEFTRAQLWKRTKQDEPQFDANSRNIEKIKEEAKHAAEHPEDNVSDPPSYQLYVPADYEPGKLYGLMVWNSAGPRGDIPKQFMDTCDKYHLIWIGASQVGNNRSGAWRIYMACEALLQAKQRFTLDSQRIYTAGGSGGGRISSIVALSYPDVFTGGCFIIGANYLRPVPVTAEPGKFWSNYPARVETKLLNQAKRDNRYVLLEGSDDINRANSKDVFAAFKKDGFKHITYLEVPGMSHQLPPAEWFDKAVDALDESLPPAETLHKQAIVFEQRRQPVEAYFGYARAALRAGDASWASDAATKAGALFKTHTAEILRALDQQASLLAPPAAPQKAR
jgi:hypothetical protein